LNILKTIQIFLVLNLKNKVRFSFHVLATLIFKLSGKRLIQKTKLSIFNITYDITVGNGDLNLIYYTNVKREYMQVEGFVPKKGAVCLDVGANIGGTSLAWYGMENKIIIYAIEPHPETYINLLRNIRLNNASKAIIPLNFAACQHNGSLEMFISNKGSMAMRPGDYQWNGKNVMLKSKRIDSIVDDEAIQKLDILKIDIEGFELDALEGGRKTLDITERIVLEYHSPKLKQGCQKILIEHGFKFIERGSLLFAYR